MRRIRAGKTKPELHVRKRLHWLGYRYRTSKRDLAGKPDLAFTRKRVAIFVHGCFWHSHQDPDCPIARRPRSNTVYWDSKLSRNRERDRENMRRLKADGWQVVVFWECRLSDDEWLLPLLELLGPPRSIEGYRESDQASVSYTNVSETNLRVTFGQLVTS